MGDFEEGNNEALRRMPPDVERVMLAGERRRKNRNCRVAAWLLLLGGAVSLWVLLHG